MHLALFALLSARFTVLAGPRLLATLLHWLAVLHLDSFVNLARLAAELALFAVLARLADAHDEVLVEQAACADDACLVLEAIFAHLARQLTLLTKAAHLTSIMAASSLARADEAHPILLTTSADLEAFLLAQLARFLDRGCGHLAPDRRPLAI